MQASVTNLFEPSLQDWFEQTYAAPTPVQEASWPLIARGQHTLITAPTGSGKTLTAFMWSLNRFARGDWPIGRTRVLYISPLKALNNDIRVNLLDPLTALRQDYGFPELSVRTRSGDTSQSERQRMLRQPPDILITTPESLNLLLTSRRGRIALQTVETVILDEIHAIVDNRRGAHLMASIERLAALAGEFQRVTLSATVHPLEEIASYVGGVTPEGDARAVSIVAPSSRKSLEYRVRFPEDAKHAAQNGQKIWDPLGESFRELIDANRSTLFFTNSRRLAEKITLKINEEQPAPLAYAHHGSLSKEIRSEVEKRLKQGELKAIVATNSLEMGIDVGALDEVVMVQSPTSINSALQRIGRAGHQVGATSVGTVFPTHAHDFLQAATLARAIQKRDIEPIKPLTNPLDVLVQVIVCTTANETWPVDDLYALITRSGSFRDLPRELFDLVIEMLAGRYAGTRVRELKPRITFDRIKNTVQASKGALLAFYNSGGSIPDRGYYTLRHADSGAPIGELDEEFVWEATTGQLFTLGTQNWQIQRITHNDVMVRAAKPGSTAPPFWRSETFNRSNHYSNLINEMLHDAQVWLEANNEEALRQHLTEDLGFDDLAAAELHEYLARQIEVTNAPLPHIRHILLEFVEGGPDGYRGPDAPKQLVIHTLWGGQLNRPLGMAIDAALREQGMVKPEVHADDNAIVIQCKDHVDPRQIISLVTADNLDRLLRARLESSGLFGARFRESAGRSLLLTKQRFDQRLPLWMSRLQAKKLMNAVKPYPDFPVLLETWRSCLQDEFNLPVLKEKLADLHSGLIATSFVSTTFPSPFASAVRFEQVSRYMYADDSPESGASNLSSDWIQEAVGDASLRTPLPLDLVERFVKKRKRLWPDYYPTDSQELIEWVKERVLIPGAEWQNYLVNLSEPFVDQDNYVVELTHDGANWVTHQEWAAVWLAAGMTSTQVAITEAALSDLVTLCYQILSFEGPFAATDLNQLIPVAPADLLDPEQLAGDVLVEGNESPHWCDVDNLESLLRMQRAERRAAVEPIAVDRLPAFWAIYQRLDQNKITVERAADAITQLSGYPTAVRSWLNDLLAARFREFTPHLFDEAIRAHQFSWVGAGSERIRIGDGDELLLWQGEPRPPSMLAPHFKDPAARYGFQQLKDAAPNTEQLREQWWPEVWSGSITADSLAPLREGLARKFELPALDSQRGRGRTRSRMRMGLQGWTGLWALTPKVQPPEDALDALERNKDKVRVLLDRYGVLNREIVRREGIKWGPLFRALMLMELAGEVTAGLYFEGMSGPQFANAQSLHLLQTLGAQRLPEHWWVNATDPAAPSGLGLDLPELPARRDSNYLAYEAGKLVLVAENHGRRLQFLVPFDHPTLPQICNVLRHMLQSRRRIEIDTINNEPANGSAYLPALRSVGELISDHRRVSLLGQV